jgi:hypothetical protein
MPSSSAAKSCACERVNGKSFLLMFPQLVVSVVIESPATLAGGFDRLLHESRRDVAVDVRDFGALAQACTGDNRRDHGF